MLIGRTVRQAALALVLASMVVLVGGSTALADIDSVRTTRGCGNGAFWYEDRDGYVEIEVYIDWAFWFQDADLWVYDREGTQIYHVYWYLPPSFYVDDTRSVSLHGEKHGRWRAVVDSSYTHSHSCTFYTSKAPLWDVNGNSYRLGNTGEEHVFLLTTSSGTYYSVSIYCSGPDFDLEILDRGMSRIGSSTSGGCNEAVTFRANDSFYFVRVYSYSGSGWYRVYVSSL